MNPARRPAARACALSPEAGSLLRAAAKHLGRPAYLVGGALRDAFLGRPNLDLDLAAHGARAAASRLAAALRASFVVLDEETGNYRLMLGAKAPVRQIDISEIQGADITADLGRRDFTINALALPIAEDMPLALTPDRVLDPRSGLADLKLRLLRCESEEILKADPLRILRAFRIAAQLDFAIEPRTQRMLERLRSRVRLPAPERTAAELTQLLAVPGGSRWVRLMDETSILTSVFEDLEASRKCAIVYYGDGGVLSHTLNVVDRLDLLLAAPDRALPDSAAGLRAELGGRLAPGHPWRATLMLAALLHDVSKPESARRVGGRLRFFGHDTAGARRAAAILKALRFPNDAINTVAAVITHHLRPGNLTAGGQITDKAAYRFFRDLGEEALALLLVCWADHASYLPQKQLERLLPAAAADPDGFDYSDIRPAEARKTLHHLQVIAQLMRRRFDAERKPVPDRLVDGKDVMKALALPPGPRIGQVLEQVREAQAEGRVRSRRQALDFVRALRKKAPDKLQSS
ncbi:MAG: HD domain-containing protein [Elusimicrobiota bacterium]|jgi:poly(A) polymerase